MMKCWEKIKSFFRPKPEAKVEEPKPAKAPEKTVARRDETKNATRQKTTS